MRYSSMRVGWALTAFAIVAQRHHHANGERQLTSAAAPAAAAAGSRNRGDVNSYRRGDVNSYRRGDVNSYRRGLGFLTPSSLFAPSATTSTTTTTATYPAAISSVTTSGLAAGRLNGNKRSGGVRRLEGKKGNDEYKKAAQELKKMEKNKERKTQERAKRREAKKAPPPRARKGVEEDDNVGISKRVTNPFKKEKIVSRFDVNDIRKVEFVGSYEDNDQEWPKTNLPEVAFLGRSNVGKSSMLNTLFGEAVAKVSKTPGRTRQINIFKAKNSKGKDVCYFADLPGYGYAKMSKEMQRNIETFLEMYLARRTNLKLLILLADSRREPLQSDAGVLQYAEDRENRPYKILLVATKVDKLNAMEMILNINRLRDAYGLPPDLPVKFSAVTGTGKKEVWSYIRQAAAAG